MKRRHPAKRMGTMVCGFRFAFNKFKAILRMPYKRHRRERCQQLREHHGTSARAPAAMRRRKRFVQIDMHRIDTQITGPCFADNGVEICAIGIKISARRVDHIGNRHNVFFKQSAGVRIGQHNRRRVRPCKRRNDCRINRSILPHRYWLDDKMN